jgi:hypothetical protein
MAGLKFAIPVNTKYSSKDIILKNEAFYDRYKNWATNQEFQGCGTFRDKDFNGKLDLGVSVLLSLEGGMKWRLNRKLTVFAGVYLDYGLNNSYKGSPKYLIKYDAERPAEFSTNSVMSLNAEKVKMMATGIKLRLTMER